MLRDLVAEGRVVWRDPLWIWPDARPGISGADQVAGLQPLLEAGFWRLDNEHGGFLWRLDSRPPEQQAWDAAQAAADAAGWEPAYPGAGWTLAICSSSACDSFDPQWTADIGLDLPPMIVPQDAHPFTMFRSGRRSYDDDQVGFYPPLQPGENVVWAVEVDLRDVTLRPECPQISQMEILNIGGWRFPTGLPTFGDDWSYEEYVRRMGLGAGVHPGLARPADSGAAVVWSDEHGHWFRRETGNTPYGWYTFDTGTMSVREVDVDRNSWDTENLWGYGPRGWGQAVGIGWIPPNAPVEEALDNPWPAFDPWMEVVPEGQSRSRPGVSANERGLFAYPYTGYIRLACGGAS